MDTCADSLHVSSGYRSTNDRRDRPHLAAEEGGRHPVTSAGGSGRPVEGTTEGRVVPARTTRAGAPRGEVPPLQRQRHSRGRGGRKHLRVEEREARRHRERHLSSVFVFCFLFWWGGDGHTMRCVVGSSQDDGFSDGGGTGRRARGVEVGRRGRGQGRHWIGLNGIMYPCMCCVNARVRWIFGGGWGGGGEWKVWEIFDKKHREEKC